MHPNITVIPLGPGAPELLTLQSADALRDQTRRVILRTARHPVAGWLRDQGVPFGDLDAFYDKYEDFDQMHAAMADWLWAEAAIGPLCFGVMDPVSDGAVTALRASLPEKAELRILPGVSEAAHLQASLPGKYDPSGGLQLYPAADFLTHQANPSVPLLITELDSALQAGEVALRLSDLYDEEAEVIFFPPSDQALRPARVIPLYQLAGQREFDHTAAVFLPGADYTHRSRFTFHDLERITARLRAPDGCPWDRVQTHESLRPFMVEEAWEAVNAIDDGDMDHLADELGDVLFQVFIHSDIGQSFDEFTLTDVVSGICRKMIHRHPHVFGHERKDSFQGVSDGWEALKKQETGSKTVGETLNDVSPSLPALKYSIKMYKKLAQIPALRRAPEEILPEIQALSQELCQDGRLNPEKMSRLLMKCTELCYRTDQDAEILLHQGVESMKRKAQKAEKLIFQDQKSPECLTFQQLCVYLRTVEGGIE